MGKMMKAAVVHQFGVDRVGIGEERGTEQRLGGNHEKP